MAQHLLLPFRRSMIICGYKTPRYQKAWGYPHYGIDISTYQGVVQQDHSIRASGEGTVVAVGNDGSLGIGIAIVYPDCIGRDGSVKPLVARYMHIKTCYVTAGQAVSVGQIIAEEGKEGTTDYHLHFELDTDTRWPVYTPQVSSANHKFWRKGTDSTLNPSLWLWQSPTWATLEPYNFGDKTWINANVDDNIPTIPTADTDVEQYKKRIAELEHQLNTANTKLETLRSLIRQAALI